MTARPKARQMTALTGGLAVSLLLLSGCAKQHLPQDTFNPAGPVASKEAGLYWFVFWIAVAVFVLVEGLLVAAMIKFRHRPGRGVPKQVHGNRMLEIAWTIAPAVLLAGVGIPTITNIVSLARKPPGALEISVVGHQWWWEAKYPKQGVTTANEIHIPVGQPVYISLNAGDSGPALPAVIHSFWIPRLAGKQDLEPGHTTHLWLEASQPGVYLGQCAEYCGLSHANMRMRVFAQSPSDFDAWVRQQLQKAPPPDPEATAALGAGGCAGCHTITGVEGFAGIIGPNLTHFGARTTFAGSIFRNTPDLLSQWLTNPQALKPGNDMTIGPGNTPGRSVLTKDQIRALVRYLESLK
jgi:cytochrome c oxidase subunit 2